MDVVSRAMNSVQRENFLPIEKRYLAGVDAPVPIGYGQTNSQPTTVRLMLTWLNAQLGQKVLDVGSGSGWTTALLATIVGKQGKVYAVERVPELVIFGQINCRGAGIKNVQFFLAGKLYGLPEHAPFDRILVSAKTNTVPNVLLDQLSPGGKMVIPLRNSVFEITKTYSGTIEKIEHPGFVFVPLVRSY